MPVPGGPQWTILFPIASSSGRTRARSASVAPTMNRLSPFSACAGERPTPASTKRIPLAFSLSAIALLAAGEIVLMSRCSMPARPRASVPSGPSTIASTSGVSGTIVTTMSAASTSAPMPAAALAPSCTRGSMRDGWVS